MDEKLKEKLVEEKLMFTRIWVDHMMKTSNKVWSSEQKRFINSLFKDNKVEFFDSEM